MYNKYIKSGNQFELYCYEQEPKKHYGRQNQRVKGRIADQFTSEVFPDYRDNPLFQAQQAKRRGDNARRSRTAFKRLVSSNLGVGERPLFMSFTFSDHFTKPRETSRYFNIFVVRMRRFFGADFRYIAVPEFQKSGRVHYHALFWGLPDYIAKRERKNRTIAKLWRKGFVDVIQTDGSPKLASYMAKYMTKALSDSRLWCRKAYFASRNVLRPVVSSGFPDYWVREEFGLAELVPVSVSEFSTAWLGQCRYEMYTL